MKVRLLISDFDGVMANSVKVTMSEYLRLLSGYGVLITSELAHETAWYWGTKTELVRDKYYPQISMETVFAIYEQIRETITIPIFNGVNGVIDLLSKHGITTCVFTSRPKKHTEEILLRDGLRHRLASVVCMEDVTREKAKPDPTGLNMIIGSYVGTGLSRSEVIYIGDGPVADYECAKKAGIKFVAMNPESVITRNEWITLGISPTDILGSFLDLPKYLGVE